MNPQEIGRIFSIGITYEKIIREHDTTISSCILKELSKE